MPLPQKLYAVVSHTAQPVTRKPDLVEMRADGELIHHGRCDDVMIYDGMNIVPAEIEQVLLRHPAVAEAAAFGVPSLTHGQIPVAAVVLKAPCEVGVLRDYCAAELGSGRARDFIVLEALPRGAGGKVLRRELLALFLKKRPR